MKDTLKPGLTGHVEVVVDEARSIKFMGEGLEVYATPKIVNDLEYACRDLIRPHLSEGEDSVGARVEIDHLKPTPMGFRARHEITVDKVVGRRVTFKVDMFDDMELAARAVHTRFIVNVARMRKAIDDKRAGAPF